MRSVQYHFNLESDPAFHCNADPDPAFHLSADPDPAPAPNWRRKNSRTWHTAKECDPIGQYQMQGLSVLLVLKSTKGINIGFNADPDPSF
jgi:hypothetical protein